MSSFDVKDWRGKMSLLERKSPLPPLCDVTRGEKLSERSFLMLVTTRLNLFF